MATVDLRIVRVGIEVNGRLETYEGFDISASGTKYGNANQNECEVKISNLKKETLDYLLTETSPYNLNRTPKTLTVDAGRVSYGTTRIFSGNIVSCNPSQPPDIQATLKCLTGNYKKGKLVSTNQAAIAQLSDISKQVANDLDVTLDFQATNKQIANYSYSGGALKQVDALGEMGEIDAYIDNDTLVVKDARIPLVNRLTIVNLDTGMVEIPELTEQGIKVKFLMDGQTTLGGALQVTSKIYPAVNGRYVIYKLGFNVTSRQEPFYWIAEGIRV